MKLTLQLLQRTKGTERFDAAFDRSTHLLIEQIDNLSHIAKSFSSFAKMPEVNPTTVDVAAKLCNFITLMRNNPAGIPIRYIGQEQGVMAIADADQITQVFTNIVKNAMQTAAKGCTCPPEFPVCVCGKTPRGKLTTRKPIEASKEELEYNHRSRSAKLRVIEKL